MYNNDNNDCNWDCKNCRNKCEFSNRLIQEKFIPINNNLYVKPQSMEVKHNMSMNNPIKETVLEELQTLLIKYEKSELDIIYNPEDGIYVLKDLHIYLNTEEIDSLEEAVYRCLHGLDDVDDDFVKSLADILIRLYSVDIETFINMLKLK